MGCVREKKRVYVCMGVCVIKKDRYTNKKRERENIEISVSPKIGQEIITKHFKSNSIVEENQSRTNSVIRFVCMYICVRLNREGGNESRNQQLPPRKILIEYILKAIFECRNQSRE